MGGFYYITKQGDMWDWIAYQVYGDETKVKELYQANPEYMLTYIFSAGVGIWCPEIDDDMDMEDYAEWRDTDSYDDDDDYMDDDDDDEE
jgi:phage tail protein X